MKTGPKAGKGDGGSVGTERNRWPRLLPNPLGLFRAPSDLLSVLARFVRSMYRCNSIEMYIIRLTAKNRLRG